MSVFGSRARTALLPLRHVPRTHNKQRRQDAVVLVTLHTVRADLGSWCLLRAHCLRKILPLTLATTSHAVTNGSHSPLPSSTVRRQPALLASTVKSYSHPSTVYFPSVHCRRYPSGLHSGLHSGLQLPPVKCLGHLPYSQLSQTPLYPAVPYSQTSQTLSLPCSSLKSAVADIPLPCTCPQPCPRHPSTLHFDLQSIATDTPPPCTYLMSDAVKRHSPLPILTVKHHKHQSSPTV